MIHLTDCKIENSNFYVAIPILKPFPAEGIDESIQEKILSEIQLLKGSYYVDGIKIEYMSLKDVESCSHITRKLSPSRYGNNRMFVFRMRVSNTTYLLTPHDQWSAEQNFILTMFFDLSIFGFVLAYALGLYGNGIFDIDNFIVYYNDVNYKICDGFLNSFPYIHENDEAFYGEGAAGLSLQKTLDWFLSIDDAKSACGKTALGKSLSIYSRMFSSSPWDEDFFISGLLSVMALEALYESNGSKKTLSEKISSFLEIDKKKCEKEIYKIYDHRCSVAHGGFEFPFKFGAPDSSKDFKSSFDKTERAFESGLLYLFKSYRKMILENRKELYFAYQCL